MGGLEALSPESTGYVMGIGLWTSLIPSEIKPGKEIQSSQ